MWQVQYDTAEWGQVSLEPNLASTTDQLGDLR